MELLPTGGLITAIVIGLTALFVNQLVPEEFVYLEN